jgi:gluconokinase
VRQATSLLQSQFEALEEPGPDEGPITVSVAQRPDEIIEHILALLPLTHR